MVLSGLNLAVTAVGFAVLNEKLKSLEGKLKEIQQEVRELRTLMELDERSKLGSALRDLFLNVGTTQNPISLKYKELLAGADIFETAMAYDSTFR
jgi:predicted nuclease with TOPRIM domain